MPMSQIQIMSMIDDVKNNDAMAISSTVKEDATAVEKNIRMSSNNNRLLRAIALLSTIGVVSLFFLLCIVLWSMCINSKNGLKLHVYFVQCQHGLCMNDKFCLEEEEDFVCF